jgi:hypothetical protein
MLAQSNGDFKVHRCHSQRRLLVERGLSQFHGDGNSDCGEGRASGSHAWDGAPEPRLEGVWGPSGVAQVENDSPSLSKLSKSSEPGSIHKRQRLCRLQLLHQREPDATTPRFPSPVPLYPVCSPSRHGPLC